MKSETHKLRLDSHGSVKRLTDLWSKLLAQPELGFTVDLEAINFEPIISGVKPLTSGKNEYPRFTVVIL